MVSCNIHSSRFLYYHYAGKAAPPTVFPAVPIDRRLSKPLYRQLYDGYRQAILEQRLRPGQRPPSTRGLADELGISRIPVPAGEPWRAPLPSSSNRNAHGSGVPGPSGSAMPLSISFRFGSGHASLHARRADSSPRS